MIPSSHYDDYYLDPTNEPSTSSFVPIRPSAFSSRLPPSKSRGYCKPLFSAELETQAPSVTILLTPWWLVEASQRVSSG